MAFKKRTKWLLIIGGVVVVVALGVISMTSGAGDEATEVQADLAYLDEISEVVTASGRIQPQTKVDIVSEVSAQIRELYVAEGDRVLWGQNLLLLDTIQLKSDMTQARFSLDEIKARAEVNRAQFQKDELEFERQTRLHKQKLTSETEYTNAKFSFESSKANLEAALAQVKTQQARLEKAEDNLRKTLIVAPMDGVITYLNAEVGEIAPAQTSFTQGKTLMTISDLSVFEVEVDVDETEIAKINLGQSAEIKVDAFRDTLFDGSIVEIGNSARVRNEGTEDYTTDFLVKVRFTEPNVSLRPGMSATVDITAATVDEALLIPYASVVTREFHPDSLALALAEDNPQTDPGNGVYAAESDDVDESGAGDTVSTEADEPKPRKKKDKNEKEKYTGVFIVSDGVAKFVEVKTGIANDVNVVALTGLTPGDTVISGSYQTLRTLKVGDPVRIDESSVERIEEEVQW